MGASLPANPRHYIPLFMGELPNHAEQLPLQRGVEGACAQQTKAVGAHLNGGYLADCLMIERVLDEVRHSRRQLGHIERKRITRTNLQDIHEPSLRLHRRDGDLLQPSDSHLRSGRAGNQLRRSRYTWRCRVHACR